MVNNATEDTRVKDVQKTEHDYIMINSEKCLLQSKSQELQHVKEYVNKNRKQVLYMLRDMLHEIFIDKYRSEAKTENIPKYIVEMFKKVVAEITFYFEKNMLVDIRKVKDINKLLNIRKKRTINIIFK